MYSNLCEALKMKTKEEKEIPTKPILEDRLYKKVWHCPTCGEVVGQVNCKIELGVKNTCSNCNQKIDTKEIEEATKKEIL